MRRGLHEARRQRQRVNRGRFRDDRIVSGALVRVLNPSQGGSVPRDTDDAQQSCSYCSKLLLLGLQKGVQSGQKRTKRSMLGYLTPTDRLAQSDEIKMEKKEKTGKDGEPICCRGKAAE